MSRYNEEELEKIEREKTEKQMEKLEAEEKSLNERIYTKDFLKEMKTARLVTIFKTIITLALFAGVAIFISKSVIVTLIFLAIFLIIKKFVQVGKSVVYESYNQFIRGFQIADAGFIGFLIGIVVVYAGLLGVQKLNDILFPPYFFIMQFAIVACLILWLMGPVFADIYFIIESSVMIKNPPETESFLLSEYMEQGNVGKFQKTVSRIKVIAFFTIVLGALLAQTAQYLVESPKLLAELDREAVYTAYAEENAAIKVSGEKFDNPDSREYKRFKAKCIDTYIFDSDNGGVKTHNTVTVTYNYKNKWVVDDYDIETELLSINLSGTWKGLGEDKYYIGNSDQFQFTLVIDKMTESEASGSFKSVPPGDDAVNQFSCTFTGTVEKKTEYDDNDNEQIYYTITATTNKPRGWGDEKTIFFTYHVGTDTMGVSLNYNALLERAE